MWPNKKYSRGVSPGDLAGQAYARKLVENSWNVMAHGDAREGKWRWNWRMEWVASTLHTTSEDGVFSITAADVHSSPASSRVNWLPRRFKWTRPFRRKTKCSFCACAITFQTQSTVLLSKIISCLHDNSVICPYAVSELHDRCKSASLACDLCQ